MKLLSQHEGTMRGIRQGLTAGKPNRTKPPFWKGTWLAYYTFIHIVPLPDGKRCVPTYGCDYLTLSVLHKSRCLLWRCIFLAGARFF